MILTKHTGFVFPNARLTDPNLDQMYRLSLCGAAFTVNWFILINRAALYLKLGGDLTDERDELLQVFGLAVLQHVLRRRWNEGQHLLLQTDDHAVEEGAHGAAQRPSLDGTAKRRNKGLQAVQIHFRAAALLHRLLVTERLTGAAEEEQQITMQ